MKKKIFKYLGITLLIIFVIFIVITVRKMLILHNIEQKMAMFTNDTNHYERITNSNGSKIEYYCKGENKVKFENIDDGKDIRKIADYVKGDKITQYYEYKGTKIATTNYTHFSDIKIITFSYGNVWNLFQTAVLTSIKSVTYDNKDCYLMNGAGFENTYIEKETGLIRKQNIGTLTVNYDYKFGNDVDDNIFIEPDISQYTIQENN